MERGVVAAGKVSTDSSTKVAERGNTGSSGSSMERGVVARKGGKGVKRSFEESDSIIWSSDEDDWLEEEDEVDGDSDMNEELVESEDDIVSKASDDFFLSKRDRIVATSRHVVGVVNVIAEAGAQMIKIENMIAKNAVQALAAYVKYAKEFTLSEFLYLCSK
jgi:hypothetical protein